ncbi:unnamed protein product [Rotaria sp. Silwood1]|nr:unnamed protein product [Rotaria sp. Silwood1]CAF0908359.1 unnamed protein product [Rotaria sp. Silwood1]CAF3376405.1 unnamed protein product [Rotaria sp. Silwood1]CAF4538940.1 unnamed protein product [Rotaria sp. Silwood1]
MALACIGYQKRAVPTRIRHRSISPSTPETPNSSVTKEEEEIDYSPSVEQQTDGTKLQRKLRLMVKEMRDIQGKYSNALKSWSKKWTSAFEQNTSSLVHYETTKQMFVSLSSIGNELAKNIDHSHRQLRHVSKLIPTEEQYPSRESQLQKARTAVNSVRSDLIEYEKELKELKRSLNRIKDQLRDPSSNKVEQSKWKSERKSVEDSIEQMKDNVEYATKMCERAEKQYHKDTVAIFEKSQEDELQRLNSLRDTLKAFLDALDVKHDSWQEAIEKHDPKQDLKVWKRTFFPSLIRLTNTH